jgi:flagellar biosynthesis component FlhA
MAENAITPAQPFRLAHLLTHRGLGTPLMLLGVLAMVILPLPPLALAVHLQHRALGPDCHGGDQRLPPA